MAEQILTDLLTVKEVAQYLDKSSSWVYEMIKKGTIPFTKIGGGYQFQKKRIDSWMKRKSYEPPMEEILPKMNYHPRIFAEDSLKKGDGILGKKNSRYWNLGKGGILARKSEKGIIRWYIVYYEDGKQKQKVIPDAHSKGDAAQAFYQKKEELNCQAHGIRPKPKRIRFDDFSKMYLEDYAKSNKLSWKTDECYIRIMNQFFETDFLEEITSQRIEAFKRWRLDSGVKNQSVNLYLKVLRLMLRLATEWDYLHEMRMPKIKLLPENGNHRIRFLSEEEEIRFFDSIDPGAPHLGPIVMVAIYTGMRKGRVLNLKWSQIDFEKEEIWVENTKSKKSRDIRFKSPLKELLLNLWENRMDEEFVFINPDTGKPFVDVSRSFDATCKRAGIENLTFHDLRHAFATRLIDAGADIITVMELMGHSSVRMTQRYTHSSRERKERAIEAMVNNSFLLNYHWKKEAKNNASSVSP